MNKPEIDGYEIQTRIAGGRRANVYRAVQTSLGRTVALKVLDPDLSCDPSELARFKLMASSTTAIRNSNIATCYGFFCSNGLNYISSEYIGGETLGRRTRGSKRLSSSEFIIMLRSIISALEAAWSHCELIHLNLKPSNVLIGRDGIVKVVDFSGLTQSSCASICRALSFNDPDQPIYSSPELISGATQLDFRSDIYSLGALSYQMITGRPPLAKMSEEDSAGNLLIPNPLNFSKSIRVEIAALIRKMMIMDPDARYASWDDLSEDIGRVMDGGLPDTDVLEENQSAIAAYAPKSGPTFTIAEKIAPANIGFLKGCVIVFIVINLYLIYLLLSPG